MSEENIWSDACESRCRDGLDTVQSGPTRSSDVRLTAVEFEEQSDREVVEEAAVWDEGDERSQSALSSWRRGFGPVGIQLTQNFKRQQVWIYFFFWTFSSKT